MPSLDNKAETISEVLDWQVNMLVRESILQNVSVNKKVKITNIMIQDAKANALATIEKLLLEAVEETLIDFGVGVTKNLGFPSDPEHFYDRTKGNRELVSEAVTTLKVVLYGEKK